MTCECQSLEKPHSKKWHYRRGITPCRESRLRENNVVPEKLYSHYVDGKRIDWVSGSSIFVPEYEAP